MLWFSYSPDDDDVDASESLSLTNRDTVNSEAGDAETSNLNGRCPAAHETAPLAA
jgi:hypothetical protein